MDAERLSNQLTEERSQLDGVKNFLLQFVVLLNDFLRLGHAQHVEQVLNGCLDADKVRVRSEYQIMHLLEAGDLLEVK